MFTYIRPISDGFLLFETRSTLAAYQTRMFLPECGKTMGGNNQYNDLKKAETIIISSFS